MICLDILRDVILYMRIKFIFKSFPKEFSKNSPGRDFYFLLIVVSHNAKINHMWKLCEID